MGDFLQWAGFSGFLALIGAAVGYGRLKSRLDAMERAVEKLAEKEDKSVENAMAIAELRAMFEERTAAILREIQSLKARP